YGHAERRVVVEARVGTQTWARRQLALPPRASEPLLLTDPPAAGELGVTLAVDDALAVDNRAVAELPESPPLEVLVVSASRELAAALGELAVSVAGSRVRAVEPERLADAEPARAVIYDRFVPPGPPRAEPALVLSTLRWLEEPPGGTALLVQTGVPVLAGPGAAEFHGPGLHVAGDPPVVLAERTGVYRVGGRVVLANLFDDRESDIGRSGGGE